MLCVIPTWSGDIQDAKRLISWIGDLGGAGNHDCLLIADQKVDWKDALKCKELAELSFKTVNIISNEAGTVGWIEGANSMFKAAAIYALEHNRPFYFNEPDAIPLKYGWLDAIENEYKTCGKKYMGALVGHETPNLPNPYLEGCSVYPADTWTKIAPVWKSNTAWPIACASIFTPQAHGSNLMQSLWGEINNPPVFAEKNIPGTNVFCLKQLNPEAVVFHRSKGGSLIRLLQKSRGISKPIVVVFPVCTGDMHLALHHARWLRSMNRKWGHKAVISFDTTINLIHLMEMRNHLLECFESVETFKYPIPPVGGWPHAPNWAWQRTAQEIARQDNAWLWMEADAVALVPDWIERIDDEYQGCGKSWMGSIVKGMGHMNGVGVYPSDACFRMPLAMASTNLAWDYVCRPEIQHDLHDAPMMGHIWTIANGEAIETGGGELPDRVSQEQARRWIKPHWSIVHRIKSADLINLLSQGWKP
jgi:hypothetical protein